MRVPEVCRAGHNLNLPSLISLEENGVENEIVSMCVARKETRKFYVRVMHHCVCVCVTTTPWSVTPLDTIFHRVMSAAILLDTFRHF